jgi:hypothetical protein
MRKVVLFGIVLACVTALSFLAGVPVERRALLPDGAVTLAAASKPAQVEVTNFPAVQSVSGTVSVGNLPVDGNGNIRVGGTFIPHFVGLTSGTLSVAGQGLKIVVLSRACAAEFANTRVCEDTDLARSIPPPPAFATVAWIMTEPSGNAPIICHDGDGHSDCGVSGSLHPVACCGF